MGWTDPADSDFFQLKEHIGALCLIAVNEYIPSMATSAGTTAAVRTEIVVIDGPGDPDTYPAHYPEALVFGKRIVPQLKNSVGSTVLGRINQGDKQPGKNAPFQLDKAGPGDGDKASAYVKAHGDVESKPIVQDTSATGQGYAPDGEQWASQRGAQPQQEPSLPTPPPYPGSSTYTQPARVGGGQEDDEAPF